MAGDSLRNDSIVLQWKISSHHNVSYLIQFRYSQLNTDWIFYRPDHPIRTDHALIQNLQPYTAYRFRVLWLLNDVTNVPQTSRYTSNFEATSPTLRPRPLISTPVSKADSAPTPFDSERLQPIYSEESVEIRTLPYGSPSVAPRLVGCLPLSPERILITYDPPRFPNDRLIGFALTATPIEHTPNQVDPADQLHRDLKAPNDDMQTQHYTLSPLQANRTYTIKLSAINGFGTGPSAQLNCSTPIDPHRSSSIAKSIAHQTSKSSSSSWISSSPLSEEPQLIFATPKTIALKRSSLPLEPVHTLLRLDDFTQNENFTAIAVHVQRGLVFTADTSGSIRRLNLQSEVTLRILQKSQLLVGWHPLAESVQVRILDMTVDWLNDRLYLVRQIRWPSIHSIRRSHLRDTALHNAMQSLNSYSTYSEQIELLRCNLDGADLRPLLRFDYGQLPVNVQIDPINGYLFWSAINNYHHLPHLQSQQFNSWWMEDVASVSSLDSIDEAMPIVPKPSISSTVYRIDLALLIANHTLSSALAESIVKLAGSQAPAFTLSPSDMRLLYVHHTQSNQSTIVRSITLDGHDAIDIREDRVERSLFQPRMRNLALFDQLLFWTMGNETFREHFASGRYFHNAIFVDQRLQPMLALRLAHPSLQPYPRPISPVVSLQALLLRTDAKIRWQAPAPLFGAGQAAFSRWKYELCIGELNAHFSTINSKRILSNAFKVNQTAESLSADSNKSNFWPPDKVSQLRKRICFELSDTFCALGQLKTNTSYVFRVRPLSPAGVGPWSNGFYGSTLPELPLSNTEKYRNWTQQFGGNKFIAPDSLYLSTEIGLIRSNLLGESVETIILPGAVQRQPLRHLAIFQQHLFANLANGSLLHVPLHAAPPGQSLLHHQAQIIGRITGASCVSIDWLTPKLYFANEVQQTISRCNFDGSSVETLPLFSTVKELRIDPINAFLYWSTGHAIEVASLNALVKYKYFQTAPFSGHLVQGLAIDYDQQSLYFLVKTVDAVMLYTGRLLTGDLTDSRPKEPLYTLHTTLPPSFALNGPVVAYADKLLWLTADQKAMITDQAGGNAAMVSTAQQVHSLALIDGHEPKALDRLNVVPIVTPDSINKTSIKIDGQPSNFTISWQSVTNVNFGRVRYELILETQEKLFELHLNEPRYQYPSASSADTSSSSLITSSSIGSVSLPVFKIAIRAYTPWAYSRRTVIFPKSSSSGRGNSSVNKPLYFEPPRRPSLTKLIKIKGGTYELTWTCDPIEHSTLSGASNSNEPPFLSLIYAVFRKPVAGDRWSLVYNGTDNRAYINFPDNELKQSHLIKLIAFNQFGESDPLHYNLNPSLDELIESQHSFDRSLMFVLVAVLATLAVAALIFYYWCKCKF